MIMPWVRRYLFKEEMSISWLFEAQVTVGDHPLSLRVQNLRADFCRAGDEAFDVLAIAWRRMPL